ncbi:hypothetical protein ACU686_05985 [Yinghuangia aomiensis]
MRRACTYVLGASSAIALLAFAAPAHAQGAEVNPGSGAPGTAITVTDGGLCAGTSASATSEAFGTVTLAGTTSMTGQGTVANVANGSYAVKLTCGNGKSASGTFTVTGSTATASTAPSTTTTAKPSGGVAAGGGGTQGEVSAAGLAAGGAFLAAGVGFGGYALRRRVSGRPTA